jgi:glycine C-acetyltransferase
MLNGEHPVVPLMVRDTLRTSALAHLRRLISPRLSVVVPKGEEEIRFQINADHTDADLRRGA